MASSNFRVKNGAEITEVLYVSGASSLRNVGVLGPVDPDVAGITVHGDISATGTIFVAGSAVGSGGSGGGAGNPAGGNNTLQYNNNGVFGGATDLNYNETLDALGIGVVANEKLTVGGNISATGGIVINGNITVDGKVDGRDIAGDAANVVPNSGSWNSVYTSLCSNSANYESVFSTLKANSAEYESVYSTTKTYSADWNYVAANSAGFDGNTTIDGKLTVGSDSVLADNQLTVVGSISALGTIYAAGSALGGAGTGGTPSGTDKSIQYNDGGALNGGNFFYDESNERVGIGTSSPNKELTVIGSISSQDIFIGDASPVITIKDTDSSGDTQLGYIQFTDTNDQVKGSIGFTNASDRNLRFTNNTEGDVRFLTNSAVAVAITSAGNVGIGTTTPDYELDVAGNIGVDQYIHHNDDTNTYINFTNDRIRFNAGGISYIDLNDAGTAPHDITFNDGGNNVDVIIKGNGSNQGNPLFKTDASTNRVGINGVGSPSAELEVDGTILATGSDPRIGIGTTTPNEALTVSGNVSATGNVTGNVVNVTTRVKATGSSLEFAGNTLDFVDGSSLSRLFKGTSAGAFEAYYAGVKKLETASGGVTVAGNISASGDVEVGGDLFVTEYIKHTGDTNTAIRFTDNKISFDAGGMTFFAVHDDDSAPFTATVNGGGNTINFRALDENQDTLLKTDSQAHNVRLYYAGNEKLSTQTDGINVTGKITASGNISANGDVFAKSVIVDGETIHFRKADGTIDKDNGPKISTTSSGSIAIQATSDTGSPTVVVITSGGTVAAVASGDEASAEAIGFPNTFTTSISTNATVFASGGDSRDWNSAYSTTNSYSADWNNTKTTVDDNSANWGTAYTHSQGSGSDHSLLGATAGTASASKALIVDSNKDIDLDGGDLTATNVTVEGDLTVQGSTIQADTVVTVTSALSVTNTGTGPALHVEQTGNNKVVEFLDDGTSVFSIANGGNISVKSSATVDGRDISADGILIDRYFDDFTNIANVSGKWNRTESSMVNDVVTTSANWNTAYTHSQGNVTDHADVSNAGSGQIITATERTNFSNTFTSLKASSADYDNTKTTVDDNSANWTTGYTHSQGSVTDHTDVSNAGSGQIITSEERDKFTRTWTNVSTSSADWNYTATNSAAHANEFSFKTITLSANRAGAAIGADIVADTTTDTLTLCAGPNIELISDPTNDVITISGSVGGGGGGSGEDNEFSFKTITLSANRAGAATGADIVADTTTDTLTLCAGPNIELISDPTNDVITISGSVGGGGGSSSDLSELAAASADWNYTAANTAISVAFDVTNNGSGAYRFNNGGFTNDDNPTLHLQRGKTYRFRVNASGHPFLIKTQAGTGTSNQYLSGVSGASAQIGNVDFEVRHDAPRQLFYQCQSHSGMVGAIHIGDATATTEVFNNSANWNTAYTTSNSLEAARTHLASASSRWDQSYLSMTTDISGNSANWDQAYITSNNNFSTLNSNSARWDTNANTELAAISARYTQTALSLETNVVPNTADWNYTAANSAITLDTSSHNYLSISNREITLGEVDISDDTNLAANNGVTLTGDTLSIDSVSASNFTAAYDHSRGNVTDHADVSNAGSGQIITADERDKFTRNWTNVSTSSANWNSTYNQVQDSGTDLNIDSNTLVVDKSADHIGIGTATPNEKLTVVGNVSATGGLNIGGNIIVGGSVDLRNVNEDGIKTDNNFTTLNNNSANWSTAYNHYIADSIKTGNNFTTLNNNSANWNTAYTHSQGNVTDHGDVSNAGSGQIITSDERDKFTRNWTNVSTSSASWNDAATNAYAVSADIAEIAALSASWTTAYNSTQTELKSNSADWNYVAANSALTLDDVTGNGSTTSNNIQVGDATITGDLTVQGATIQADTIVTVTSALSVTNTGTGPALHVEQKGNNKVVEFLDDGTAIFSIANGGAITVGTWNGTAIANDYVAALPTSKITSGTFADARIASSNVTQHQGDITGTGALNSGSITSGFGNIDNGSSSLTTGAIIAQQLRVTTTTAPTNYTSAGTKGDIAYDDNYLYICVSNNNWRRIAIAAW